MSFDDPKLTDRERDLIAWTNTLREQAGREQLEPDGALMAAARKHAQHMAKEQHLCEPTTVPDGQAYLVTALDYPKTTNLLLDASGIGYGSYTKNGKAFSCFVVAVKSNGTVYTASSADAERALLPNYHAASVEVVIGATGERNCFSGTIVEVSDTKARVLTCAHGLKPGEIRVHVAWPPRVYRGAKVVASDKALDLSIIEFEHPPVDKLIPVLVGRSDHELRVGDAAVFIGKGRDPAEQVTKVASVNKFQDKPNFEVVAPEYEPGRSGGGAFQRGRLVGVVWGNADGLSVARGLPALRTMLLGLPRIGAIDIEDHPVALLGTIDPEPKGEDQ